MIFRLENIKYKGILNIDDLKIPAYMVTCLTGGKRCRKNLTATIIEQDG
ncbi:hypothetical protein RCO48_29755 [Peribacillus frigoritolerans]|nr:hypothetical protein [Peribacillus frigoritolerans]